MKEKNWFHMLHDRSLVKVMLGQRLCVTY